MRIIVSLMIVLSMVAGTAFADEYHQEFREDGTSIITKTMDLSAFMITLGAGGMERIASACGADPELGCEVNIEEKTISMEDRLDQGEGYYTFETDYSLPDIRHKAVIYRIPSDIFESRFDAILSRAGEDIDEGRARMVLDLTADNSALLSKLSGFDIQVSYTARMPDGSESGYDLLDLLGRGGALTIESEAPNIPAFTLIAGIIAVALLSASFFRHKREV